MTLPVLTASCCSVAAIASVVAAVTDVRTGRIPNWLTLPTAVLGLALHGTLGSWAALAASATGLLVGAAIPTLVYVLSKGQAIGGGDVKLFAAIGALLGPGLGLETQLGAFLVLSMFAIVQLAFRGQLLGVLRNTAALAFNPVLPRSWRREIHAESLTEMRMGPAIAISVVVTLLSEQLRRLLPWLA